MSETFREVPPGPVLDATQEKLVPLPCGGHAIMQSVGYIWRYAIELGATHWLQVNPRKPPVALRADGKYMVEVFTGKRRRLRPEDLQKIDPDVWCEVGYLRPVPSGE